MSTYLLEVGTEELPYKFIPQAIAQLNEGFTKFLNENANLEKTKLKAISKIAVFTILMLFSFIYIVSII